MHSYPLLIGILICYRCLTTATQYMAGLEDPNAVLVTLKAVGTLVYDLSFKSRKEAEDLEVLETVLRCKQKFKVRYKRWGPLL